MSCRGICRRHPRYIRAKKIEYAKGMKVCISCDRAIFVNIEGTKCPCCNKSLRTRPQYHGDRGRTAREATLHNRLTSY
ncbi:MAG TPA: hypothetical protein VHA09_00140 [Nitrososphaera sp.]|nr:hypothetical protein [Nitrososphaera sp.]